MRGKKWPSEGERLRALRETNIRSARKWIANTDGKASRALTYAKHGARHARDHRARVRAMVQQLKSVPCADCRGTFDPVCMDFDHRPGETKLFTVGTLAGSRSVDAIRAEIAKCDVVCSNCHRLRTFRQRDHRVTTAQAKSTSAAPTLQLGLKLVPDGGV